MSWNVRSLNETSKAKKILQTDADISLIQEVWHPKDYILGSLPGNLLSKTRPQKQEGGGTMAIYKDRNLISNIADPIEINKDSFINKIELAANRFIWLSSVYLCKGTKQDLIETMTNIQRNVPSAEWPFLLLAGDWNIDIEIQSLDNNKTNPHIKKKKNIQEICKQMGLNILSPGRTRATSTLDFVVFGSEIEVQNLKTISPDDLSDHEILTFDVITKIPTRPRKIMRIPDRKTAEKFTINSFKKANNCYEFLINLEKRMRSKNLDIMKKVKKKHYKKEILQLIMESVCDDEDLHEIVKDYWKKKSLENEEKRFSQQSAEAFVFLKKVYKYQEYQKKDGSIINKVLDLEGKVITEEDHVNKLVIEALKSIQLKEDEPQYTKPEPFPKLPPVTEDEMESMLDHLSTNKAIAYDGMTDTIFNKTWKEQAKKKLITTWDVFESHEWQQLHFDSRLIPLNKVHPSVPQPSECRPIVVTSPIVKLLEVRLKEKLDQYSTQKLISSQTGFIHHSGIIVNQHRLIDRIRLRTCDPSTETRRRVYGLFIDFSSAYNTVLHSKLYGRLEKVLSTEEIQLVKALYSRNRIRLGKHSFTPNIGVGQGSIISPALFNIYCEGLYEELIEKGNIGVKDLLGYADDLLILCSSTHQLRRVISIIKEWSHSNNLKLNPKKSGILEFLPRRGNCKRVLKINSLVEEIPVVDKYKYLGIWIDSKITIDPQIKHINDKTNFLSFKLWPLLGNVSLDYRINLWNIMVRPLFEMLIMHYKEECETSKIKILGTIRKTFKQFTRLKKGVPNYVIEEIMNYNYDTRVDYVNKIASLKWDSRLKNQVPDYEKLSQDAPNQNDTPKERMEKVYYPSELQILLNLMTALCPSCKKRCTASHMLQNHQIYIPGNDRLIEKCKEVTRDIKKRRPILENLGNYMLPFISCLKKHLGK